MTRMQPQQLSQFYRKLAIQLHPDKNRHPQATDAFQVVQAAMETAKKSSSSTYPGTFWIDPESPWASNCNRRFKSILDRFGLQKIWPLTPVSYLDQMTDGFGRTFDLRKQISFEQKSAIRMPPLTPGIWLSISHSRISSTLKTIKTSMQDALTRASGIRLAQGRERFETVKIRAYLYTPATHSW